MPASAGGVSFDCPACGRAVWVPLAVSSEAENESDIETIERMTGRRFRASIAPPFRPPPLLALAMTALTLLLSLCFCVRWADVAIATGAGLAWWLALSIAQSGATRER